MQQVREFIERRGWVLKMARPETLEADLECAAVLWYLSDWNRRRSSPSGTSRSSKTSCRAAAGSWSAGWAGRTREQGGPAGKASTAPYAADLLGKPLASRSPVTRSSHPAIPRSPCSPGDRMPRPEAATMDARPVERKPWAVLAYTVADDKGTGDSLDAAAKEELKSLCNAADFGQMSVAAQVDFKHTRGVFRGVLTEPPPKTRGFESIPADSHPLWRSIKARLDRAKLRVLKEAADLNASRANVLGSFLRFGQRECPADRYVVFFYGHGYGPLGLFFDAEADDAQAKVHDGLATLSDSLDRRRAGRRRRLPRLSGQHARDRLPAARRRRVHARVPVDCPDCRHLALANLPRIAEAGRRRRGRWRVTSAEQLALFLDTPANREPFADVPYSLIDLGAAHAIAEPLKALADALDAARPDAARRTACAAALEAARIGFPDDQAAPGDPALLDVPTMCENLAGSIATRSRRRRGRWARSSTRRLVTWHHSQQGRHRGIGLYYRPVKPEHATRSHLYDAALAGRMRALPALALSPATGWDWIALDPLT